MVRLALIGVAGFVAAVALTGPAAGDLVPTLPTLPAAPPPPAVPPAPPVAPPPLPALPPAPPVAPPAAVAPPPTRSSTSGRAPTHDHGGTAPAARSAVVPVRLGSRGTLVFIVHSGCELVGSRSVPARRGVNNVRFAPRLHGRSLSPGIYRVSVEVVRDGQRRQLRTIGIEVARERGGLTSTRRPAPAVPDCTTATLPPPVLAAASPLASVRVTSPRGLPAPRSGVLGVTFTPPRLGPAPALPGDGAAAVACPASC